MVSPTHNDIISDLKAIAHGIAQEIKVRQKGQKQFKKAVSDHAVLRYLERVKCVDIEAVRREILSHDTFGAIKHGACRIKCGKCELVIANGTVVTVIGRA